MRQGRAVSYDIVPSMDIQLYKVCQFGHSDSVELKAQPTLFQTRCCSLPPPSRSRSLCEKPGDLRVHEMHASSRIPNPQETVAA